MASYHYERLSAMDNSFLASETPTTPMHVAGLEVFEAGPLRTEHGGIDIARIRAAYESVLHRMPRYRQKLMWTPVEDRPAWIDDPHFNLDYHLRHVSLPRPGNDAELKRVASRLIANHLDRRRPLWEAWVIEGLERDRFAILAKTHHCMIDGLAGVEIAQLMLSPSPEEEIPEPEPWRPRPAPTPTELLRDEAFRYAGLPLRALRGLRALSNEVEDVGAELRNRYRAMQHFVDASTSASSPTPINGPLGPHRRFDWVTMELDDVKAIRRKLDCTVNDVFLATATQAFRSLLLDEGLDLEEIVFRASTPVSLRPEGDHGTTGNQVASWFVQLPVGEPDRLAQLRAIRAETGRLKESDEAQGMGIAMAATDLLPTPLLNFAAGFASSAVNTVITNVPGPQIPLYMRGAPLEAILPGVPLLQNIGLGIALMTYNGRVFWGLTSDYDLVPDLECFGERVAESFAGLAEAAGVTLAAEAIGQREA
jgi:WS/DGAT/MGAT family acyltransferase